MKRPTRSLAILAALGGATLLLGEAALRVFWPEQFPDHVPGMYAPHTELGHVLVPNHETVVTQPEYRVTVRTNSEGFRGEELSPKRDTTLRIVCLGDWLTFGEGVENSETYPALLEAALRRRHPKRDIQVVNAGIPQYGSQEELAYLKTFAARLEPDVVIAQFYAGDDFEQARASARDRYRIQDDRLVQTDEFSAATGPAWLVFLDWLKHRSHVARWASERAGNLAMRTNLLSGLEQASSAHFSDADAQFVKTQFAEIEAVGAALGASTLFLFAPEKMQVLPGEKVPVRAAGVVMAVARETGAGFLDLTAMLVEHPDPESLFLTWIGTWRPETYRLAAALVAEKLVALGWIGEVPGHGPGGVD